MHIHKYAYPHTFTHTHSKHVYIQTYKLYTHFKMGGGVASDKMIAIILVPERLSVSSAIGE